MPGIPLKVTNNKDTHLAVLFIVLIKGMVYPRSKAGKAASQEIPSLGSCSGKI